MKYTIAIDEREIEEAIRNEYLKAIKRTLEKQLPQRADALISNMLSETLKQLDVKQEFRNGIDRFLSRYKVRDIKQLKILLKK